MSQLFGAWLSPLSPLAKRAFSRKTAPLALLLVIATLVRLPLMLVQGYWHDLATYVFWGNELVTRGASVLYAVRASSTVFPGVGNPGGAVSLVIDYPPGMPYLFGGVILLYNLTLAHVLHAPLTALVVHDGAGPFIAKLALLIADLATTILLYREARARHSQRFAWLAAGSFALSPAVLYDGVIWGQTDTLVALPILVAIFAILAERYSLAGVSFALAVLLKPQPVVLLPLMLLYLWRWRRREQFIRFVAAFAGTVLLLLLPIMIPRFQLPDMIYNMQAIALNGAFPISLDAYNFWWLIGLHAHSLGSSLLGVRLSVLADMLVGVVTLVIGLQIWRRPQPAYFCFGLALEEFGVFLFMGSQLERYLFLLIPLMLATLIVSQRNSSNRLLIIYVCGTALCLLNMLASIGSALAGVSPMIPYVSAPALSDAVVNHAGQISFAISAYVAATFGYALWVYLAGQFAPLACEGATHSEPDLRQERQDLLSRVPAPLERRAPEG